MFIRYILPSPNNLLKASIVSAFSISGLIIISFPLVALYLQRADFMFLVSMSTVVGRILSSNYDNGSCQDKILKSHPESG